MSLAQGSIDRWLLLVESVCCSHFGDKSYEIPHYSRKTLTSSFWSAVRLFCPFWHNFQFEVARVSVRLPLLAKFCQIQPLNSYHLRRNAVASGDTSHCVTSQWAGVLVTKMFWTLPRIDTSSRWQNWNSLILTEPSNLPMGTCLCEASASFYAH